jgi:hypothetical protein
VLHRNSHTGNGSAKIALFVSLHSWLVEQEICEAFEVAQGKQTTKNTQHKKIKRLLMSIPALHCA